MPIEATALTPDAERVLASFIRIFLKTENDIRIGKKFEAMELLKGCSKKRSNRDKLFTAKHELFRSRLLDWLDSLGEFAQKQVCDLARIAAKNPQSFQSYCEGGKEAHWARMKVEGLLIKSLKQELSPSSFGPNRTELSTPATSVHLSAVGNWSRWVCEGGPGFDISKLRFGGSGAESWAAPAWYDDCFSTSFWIRSGRPERLTVERTERVCRSYQELFAERLQRYVLKDAEDRAVIELAGLDRVSAHDKSQLQLKTLTKKTNQPRHSRAQVVNPILAKKGWSVQQWAMEANVDHHTAFNYLNGSTRRPCSSTRKTLADSLGIAVDDLPI